MNRIQIAALAATAGLIVGAVALYSWSAINITRDRAHIVSLKEQVQSAKDARQKAVDDKESSLVNLAREAREAGLDKGKAERDLKTMTKYRDSYREKYEKEKYDGVTLRDKIVRMETYRNKLVIAAAEKLASDSMATAKKLASDSAGSAQSLMAEANRKFDKAEALRNEVFTKLAETSGLNYTDYLVFYDGFLGREIAKVKSEKARLERIVNSMKGRSVFRNRGTGSSTLSKLKSAEMDRYRVRIRALEREYSTLESKQKSVRKAIDSLPPEIMKAYRARR